MKQPSTVPEFIVQEQVETLAMENHPRCTHQSFHQVLDDLQELQKASRLLEDLSGSIANRLQELALLLSAQVSLEQE